MFLGNSTEPTEFTILGFYEWPDLQIYLFLVLLFIYMVALTGNLTIFTVIVVSPHLHTPMYFFLGNLSIIDITFTTTILPKLLDICLTGNQSITYVGCLSQMFFFVICVASEYIHLTVMAYDRYLAICHPLSYMYLMNFYICARLTLFSWCIGFLDAFVIIGIISQYSFCRSKTIDHLFCEVKPLLKLSCTGTHGIELAIQITSALFGFIPLTFIIITYIFIISSIMRIRSNEGKQKAFSTCSSHLVVVTLFFVIILGLYTRPKSNNSAEQDKLFSLLYTTCIPMLNPIIYSLRNKEVKLAVKKITRMIVGQLALVKNNQLIKNMFSKYF